MSDTKLPLFLVEADGAIMKDSPHLEYLKPIIVEGVGQFTIVPGTVVPVFPAYEEYVEFDDPLGDEPEETTKPAKGKKS